MPEAARASAFGRSCFDGRGDNPQLLSPSTRASPWLSPPSIRSVLSRRCDYVLTRVQSRSKRNRYQSEKIFSEIVSLLAIETTKFRQDWHPTPKQMSLCEYQVRSSELRCSASRRSDKSRMPMIKIFLRNAVLSMASCFRCLRSQPIVIEHYERHLQTSR